jgi:DNA invertase Pin-like site-specific DNA recombinase
MSTPVAILVRVSTDDQNNARQLDELQAVAAANQWEVVEVIREDGVSGSSRVRPGVARALVLAESGQIKKLLVHEISRLARNPAVLHDTVERMCEVKVSIYWHAQAIETILPNGKRNPAAGLMLALLGEVARQERETLSERTKSGIEKARRNGVTLGRPVGSSESTEEFLEKHKRIVRCLRNGDSVRKTAKFCGKSKGTVERVKKALEPEFS